MSTTLGVYIGYWSAPNHLGLQHWALAHDAAGRSVLLDSWTRGRIGLLGDAAFSPSALTGQGTSLALVGAYVLAGELAAEDLAAGLSAYERRLRPWVLATQRTGREGADDSTLRAVANGFTLPDYPQLKQAAVTAARERGAPRS